MVEAVATASVMGAFVSMGCLPAGAKLAVAAGRKQHLLRKPHSRSWQHLRSTFDSSSTLEASNSLATFKLAPDRGCERVCKGRSCCNAQEAARLDALTPLMRKLTQQEQSDSKQEH